MESKDFPVKPAACPNCGVVLEAAMSVGCSEAPEAGDVTVCVYCAAGLKFDSKGGLERLSDDELASIALDCPTAFSLLVRAQNAIGEQNFRSHRGENGATSS